MSAHFHILSIHTHHLLHRRGCKINTLLPCHAVIISEDSSRCTSLQGDSLQMWLHLPSLRHEAPTHHPVDTLAPTHPADVIPRRDCCKWPGIHALCIYLPSCWVNRDVLLCSACYAGDSGLDLLQKQVDMLYNSSPRPGEVSRQACCRQKVGSEREEGADPGGSISGGAGAKWLLAG